MLQLVLAAALAAGPVFDPVIVRPGTNTPDAAGQVIRTNTITANYPITVASDGGSVLLGLAAPYCVGVDRGLGFDSGFFCQVWDAGSPLVSSISGVSPIVATSDGGRGYTISLDLAVLDAGTVKVVTGTSPIVVNADAGGGYDVTFPSWASTAAVDKYLSMTGTDTGNCQTTACRTWAYIDTTIPYRAPYSITLHVDAGTYSEALNFKNHVFESSNGSNATITVEGPPQTATTVATGSNTGHATAVSNGAGTDYSYITDSTQTWTTDDLQGAWVDFAGTKYVIARNTATRLTIPNTLSPVPAVDAGYTIMRPAATFTGGSLSTALDVEYGGMGSGSTISVSDVAFTSTGIGIRQLSRNRLTLTRVSSIATGAFLANISAQSSTFGGLVVSNSFLKGAGGTVSEVSVTAGSVVKLTSSDFSLTPRYVTGWGAAYIEPTGGNGTLRIVGPGEFTATSLFLHCVAGSQYGLYLQSPLVDNTLITGSYDHGYATTNAGITNLIIDNCLRPVVVAGESQLAVQTTASLTGELTSAGSSVAITVNDGAHVKVLPAPVVSDAGTELSMDLDTYRFYNASSTATKSVRNLLTNSYYKQGTVSAGGFSATGGTITDVGGYRIHTFTSSGTFTVTGTGTVDVLVVAGGGGAGYSRGGGGGAGGVIVSPGYSVSSGAISVTVGAGGAAQSSAGNGNNGSNSVFDALTAIGGGGGAGANGGTGTAEVAGNSGGSGGGTTGFTVGTVPGLTVVAGGSGTSSQGTAGGRAYTDNTTYIGAGGGGGASTGGTAADGSGTGPRAGNGGAGISNSYSGSAVYYGGGGGGGAAGTVTAGTGGAGGGGNGSVFSPTAGTANTGGGGGGASYGQPGAAGGSGIVIVRYVYP